jgi:hypothetical protein
MNHIKLKELTNRLLQKLTGSTRNFKLNEAYLQTFQNLKYQILNSEDTEKLKSKNRYLP